MSVVSDRLRQLRAKAHKTQAEVAKDVHIHIRSMESYENDTRTPRAEQLCDLADYYNVSVDYLVGRTDDPTPPVHRVTADVVGKPDTTGD